MWSEAKNGVDYRHGDVIRLGSIVTPGSRSTATTTSTSWNSDTLLGQTIWNWNKSDVPLNDLRVAFRGTLVPGTNETAYIRFQSVSAGDTVIEVSRSSFDRVHTGWQTYSPSSPNYDDRIRVEYKTSSGTNSSEFRYPVLELGVQID